MLRLKKIIVLLLIFNIIMSILTLGVSATTKNYESENNDTISKADVTYDDYNNYGRLDSLDVDWWSFTATRTGMANIWLGNIPADCDYEMTLYTQDGDLIAESTNMLNDNEFIKCRVVAGTNYKMYIMRCWIRIHL